MANGLCASLYHSIHQAGERPVSYGVRQDQWARNVHHIVGQGMEAKPHFVGFEALAGQSCPFERVFAFLDLQLCSSATIVELKHPFIGNSRRRDHKAHTWKHHLDASYLGHTPVGFAPDLGLINEVGIVSTYLSGYSDHLFARSWVGFNGRTGKIIGFAR